MFIFLYQTALVKFPPLKVLKYSYMKMVVHYPSFTIHLYAFFFKHLLKTFFYISLIGFVEKEIKKANIPILDTGENPEVPFPRDMIDLEVIFVS